MEELELIPRAEVMAMLKYKSLGGFKKFAARCPDFPKPVARTGAINARVCYFKADVLAYIKHLREVSRGQIRA